MEKDDQIAFFYKINAIHAIKMCSLACQGWMDRAGVGQMVDPDRKNRGRPVNEEQFLAGIEVISRRKRLIFDHIFDALSCMPPNLSP
jgi:hypothetical protein